ncbi:hypothetical protein B0H66DRAFT_568885 [Apodospora peruviana]|uniref:Uncharacterized protein n=1 Tax=Apodospora peruviana TaxID=516989 RepID=A0AAE0HUF0_9PEZI|nr:hypothetical protein B0H66DRAFT_568885 [Apodospora peruviana]
MARAARYRWIDWFWIVCFFGWMSARVVVICVPNFRHPYPLRHRHRHIPLGTIDKAKYPIVCDGRKSVFCSLVGPSFFTKLMIRILGWATSGLVGLVGT